MATLGDAATVEATVRAVLRDVLGLGARAAARTGATPLFGSLP